LKDKLDKVKEANNEEFEEFVKDNEKQLEAHERLSTSVIWPHWRMIQSKKSTSWQQALRGRAMSENHYM
jgi:hypothetical protein